MRHDPSGRKHAVHTLLNASAMKELSFEEAYNQLEETVRTLEVGGVNLEEATRLFEEGVRLARLCHQYLGATELKITQLRRSFTEQMALLEDEKEDIGT